MKNKRNKMIVIMITILLAVATVAISFAYFTALIEGNESTSTIYAEAGIMTITYENNSGELKIDNVYPREEAWVTKTFTLTGNNTTDLMMNYVVGLKQEKSTFSNGSLTYTLVGENVSNTGKIIGNLENQVINDDVIYFGLGKFLSGKNMVHRYTLSIYYKDNGQNQNVNQGASFAGYVFVESGGNGVDVTALTTDGNEVLSNNWSSKGLNFKFAKSVTEEKAFYCVDLEDKCEPDIEVADNTTISDFNDDEGIYYLRYRSMSPSGVLSPIDSFVAKVDSYYPTGELSVLVGAGAVRAEVTASDNEGGTGLNEEIGWKISTSDVCDETSTNFTYEKASSHIFTVPTEGDYYVCVSISDNSGNTTYLRSDKLNVKTTGLPIISFAVNGVESSNDSSAIQRIDDGNGNWRIKFLKSGSFRLYSPMAVDLFAVGGGGGGGAGNYSSGGGGGYTKTVKNTTLPADTQFTVTVGSGGAAGVMGGTSSFKNGDTTLITAAGGNPGSYNNTITTVQIRQSSFGGIDADVRHIFGVMGGTGGSPGGISGWGCAMMSGSSWGPNTGGNGASYGASISSYYDTIQCVRVSYCTPRYEYTLAGQGSTTCEFGEGSTTSCTNGDIYAYSGGGAGTGGYCEGRVGGNGNPGLYGGAVGTTATANRGGGGGGKYGVGGSGVVVIRNAR